MTTYRADHVGSFLRPPALLEARGAHAEGRIVDAELREAEDRAIMAVLALQREAGLDVYSDGEYRRHMWITGLPAAVDGFGAGAMVNIPGWRRGTPSSVSSPAGTRPTTAGQAPPAGVAS